MLHWVIVFRWYRSVCLLQCMRGVWLVRHGGGVSWMMLGIGIGWRVVLGGW